MANVTRNPFGRAAAPTPHLMAGHASPGAAAAPGRALASFAEEGARMFAARAGREQRIRDANWLTGRDIEARSALSEMFRAALRDGQDADIGFVANFETRTGERLEALFADKPDEIGDAAWAAARDAARRTQRVYLERAREAQARAERDKIEDTIGREVRRFGAMVRADAGTRAEALASGFAHVEAILRNYDGILGPDEAAGIRSSGYRRMWTDALAGMEKARDLDGVRAALKRLDGGELDAALAAQDKAAMARAALSAVDVIERARKADRAVLGERVSAARDALHKGRTFAGLTDLKDDLAAAGAADLLRALESVEDLAAGAAEFARRDPGKQADEIAELRGAVATDHDNARLDILEAIRRDTVASIRASPLEHAWRTGMLEARALDPTDVDSVGQRVEDSDFVRELYGLSATPLLTRAEGEALTATLRSATPAEQSAMFGAMYEVLGRERFPAVLESISVTEPELAHAGAWAARGDAGTGKAVAILEGLAIRKAQPDFTPKEDDAYRTALHDALPQKALKAFSPAFRAGLRGAVEAVYARFSHAAGDTSGIAVDHRLAAAVRLVTGGFVAYRDFVTMAPVPDMSDDEFADLMDGLDDDDLAFGGGPVSVGGDAVTAGQVRENGTLLALGGGRYAVEIAGYLVAARNGGSFVLDLGAKAAEAAPEAAASAPQHFLHLPAVP